MANLVVVPNAIQHLSGGRATMVAGGTLSAGDPVYIDTADSNKIKQADSNAAGKDDVYGIVLEDCVTDDEVAVATTGARIDLGATLGVGTLYVLSDTAGKICPAADLSTGEKVTLLGVGEETDVMWLNLWTTGVTTP